MAEVVTLPIPFWIAQFQVLGGKKRFFTMTGVYATVFVFGVFTWCRAMRFQSLAVSMSDLLNILTVLQVGLMLFGGANAIYRGILRDHRTKMLESHRIAPISNVGVVLGYMLGSTTQIMGLCFVNFIGGIALNLIAEAPFRDWILGNAFLFSTSLMVWALAVLLGMRPTKPLSPAPVLILAGVLATPLFLMLPGGAIIAGGYGTVLAYGLMLGRPSPAFAAPAAVFVSIVCIQLVLGLMWLMLAAAKYRRPDLPVFNARRGLGVVLLWLLIGLGAFVGVVRLSVQSGFGGRVSDPESIPAAWIGTLAVTLIVAGIAIAGAVETQRLVRNGSQARDRWDRVPDIVVAGTSILLFAGLAFAALRLIGPDLAGALEWPDEKAEAMTMRSWLMSSGAAALALLSVWAVARFARLRPKSAPVIIGIFMVLAWAVPPIVEFTRTMIAHEMNSNELHFGPLMGFSPIGTIIGVWTDIEFKVKSGLVFQGVLLAVLLILAVSTQRRGSASHAIGN